LNAIAASVARVLPNGEKNGLRKTYKGKIKELGISGKFDVTVQTFEPGASPLLRLARAPEQDWAVHERQGREVERGLSANARSALPAACTMAKGVIPKQMWDCSVLGELDLTDKKPSKPRGVENTATYRATSAQAAGRIKSVNSPMPVSSPGYGEERRPKRVVKKRTYDDSSFEGYGEGFVDDDLGAGAYDDGEEERGSGKRRKKVSPDFDHVWEIWEIITDVLQAAANQNQYAPSRHGSYGPGMVGA
jgi:hypothetical protein